MSKLTNLQIRAQMAGLELSIRQRGLAGDAKGAARRRARLSEYKTELAAREAAGRDPQTHELQDVLYGEPRR